MSIFSMDDFYKGNCFNAYKYFGAHPVSKDRNDGIVFRVYAPAAYCVDVIGDFNNWQGCVHRMNKLDGGVFEVCIPEAKIGQLYKFRVYQQGGGFVDKADPYAFHNELRPNTASIITYVDNTNMFHDEEWMNERTKCFDEPLNIYELHLGSWRKPANKSEFDGGSQWYRYDEIANDLIKYLKENHYTHLEIMPLAEYPFDGSWGYQAALYFCPTSRYGTPEQLMMLIDRCHKNGIGVIIDFAFVHFVKDSYSLGNFDGTALYEYPPSDVNQSEWGSYNFNLSKGEVQSYIMSSAAFWLDVYHFDGIRMDAISNAIYWMGNKNRGVNDRAVQFFKKMNYTLHIQFKNCILIAEDSSDYPGVTTPSELGGLGFDYKWDLGWMNDTLEYFKLDPFFRKDNHNKLNWSMAYFYNEKYILPFSHDEVVHGKATIVQKMWGDNYDNKFAQARTLYAYMFTHPGKKLNFMGNELGMFREWDENKEMDWLLIEQYPKHKAFHDFFRELCGLVTQNAAFYEKDYDKDGFMWIDATNNVQNIYSYYRMSEKQTFVVVCNMSPVLYENFRLGLRENCTLTEVLNSDAQCYGGTGILNKHSIKSEPIPERYFNHSALITLPPFGTCIFKIKEKPLSKKSAKKSKNDKQTVKTDTAETEIETEK